MAKEIQQKLKQNLIGTSSTDTPTNRNTDFDGGNPNQRCLTQEDDKNGDRMMFQRVQSFDRTQNFPPSYQDMTLGQLSEQNKMEMMRALNKINRNDDKSSHYNDYMKV